MGVLVILIARSVYVSDGSGHLVILIEHQDSFLLHHDRTGNIAEGLLKRIGQTQLGIVLKKQ
ncbi:hypothetical protein D3C80_2009620 [compost metagenome]